MKTGQRIEYRTDAMRQRATALADVLPTFNRGRSKVNSRQFFVIPASDGVTAHWTALDGRGCTCKGNRRRGTCTHTMAAVIVADREREALGLASDAEVADHDARQLAERRMRASYDELFPAEGAF